MKNMSNQRLKKTDGKKTFAIIIVWVLLLPLLISGCLGPPYNQDDNGKRYELGKINVDFKNNVTLTRAIEVAHSQNVSVYGGIRNDIDDRNDNMSHYWTLWLRVPEGEEKKHVRLFNNLTEVKEARLERKDDL